MTGTDVVGLCADLIRFDTTNYGGGRSAGERDAAEYLVRALDSVGLTPHLLGPTPERSSVIVRVPGADRSLPAFLVHAHLDVVPAEAEQWSVEPFAGTVSDGYLYGRGAVDMKHMVAMTLATLLGWADAGVVPRRDIVVAFVADEEDRGDYGAGWLVAEHAELFSDVAAAIGESGGTGSILTADDGAPVVLFPVAAAERGTLHMRVTATGTSGHGSRPNADNAVSHLVGALSRVIDHEWPVVLTPTVESYLAQTMTALRHPFDLSSAAGVEAAVDRLGDAGIVARTTIRCSATPTVLDAGYKVNVIPGTASAELDVRCLPGTEESTIATIDELLGDRVSRVFLSRQSPVQAPVGSAWFDAMRQAILRHDPAAVVVPYCMGGGTDAKAFSRLGIACYGFAPLGLDPQGRMPQGMHGIDERVPVASLVSGQRILADFLASV